jgi:uncharacterized protein (DUF1015 family)
LAAACGLKLGPRSACYNAEFFLFMAILHPFRAFRYDPARVQPQLAVTQPYDKITPAMQAKYYEASPYSLVRIILGKTEAKDGEGANVYTRAAQSFEDWRKAGVLKPDAEPSFYTYTQSFAVPGSNVQAERRGLIAAGQIEEYGAGVVFRHEQTLAKPKSDRLNLLRATKAHFGHIFMLYSDAGEVDALLASPAAPDIEVIDEYQVTHRVWKVSDPKVIAAVQEKMREQRLIIADGHHRYETSLNYRNERRAAGDQGPAPYDSVMMTLVNMNSPGMVILPTHRVVHGLAAFSETQFIEDARKHFSVEEVLPTISASHATAVLRESGKCNTALIAVTGSRAFLLHSPKSVGTPTFSGFSLRQQALDVVQLHKGLLEGVLGLSEESIRNQENLSYLRDTGEAIARARNGANVSFLMNPCRVEQVRDIAFAGEVLPQKSTDFFPKMLDGLTIYAVD